MVNEEKLDLFKALVYNEIRNKATKAHPIKERTLRNNLNISRRVLQKVLVTLREDYPIVAKETEDGGYWIAEDEADIIAFIQMMTRRKNGYENTITLMNNFLTDYGNIPNID